MVEQPAVRDRRPARSGRRLRSIACRSLVALGFVTLLSGCLLISGERTTTDVQNGAGNLSTAFVSAEGEQVRALKVAEGPRVVQVIVVVTVESGDLRLDLLQPDGEVILAAEGRPDDQVAQSAQVQTDNEGYLRYRVYARGARNGSYQLLFQVL